MKAGHSERMQETRLEAFEMKGLRKILRVSWTAKKTNEWVLNKAGVKRELLDEVKARKLAYCSHTMKKQGNCLEKEILQETMPGVRRRGRPRTAWIDNIKSWTGPSVEESNRMTEGRYKWRSTSMVWPTLGSRTAKEQNRITNVRAAYKYDVLKLKCQHKGLNLVASASFNNYDW